MIGVQRDDPKAMKDSMYITSTGMVCPVGLNTESACAAMRAGIAQFEELHYLDNDGEPIVGTMTPGLNADLKFEERLVEMLATALTNCLKDPPTIPLENIPLLVGLPETDRPGVNKAIADRIIDQVQEKLQVQFHPELSCTISNGHTAGFQALQIARELIKARKVSACLICGVDSYINARSLLWLDHFQRLKTEENSDGVIPGEAAAAVLIERQKTSGQNVWFNIVGLGFGKEKASVLSDEPLLGLGLSEAARSALVEAKLSFHEMDWRFSDMTGEQYAFKEMPLVEGRLVRVVRKESQPLWHCFDSIGDIGAASGVAQLVVADQAFRKEYAPGDRAICFCSSVQGDRAAAVLQRSSR